MHRSSWVHTCTSPRKSNLLACLRFFESETKLFCCMTRFDQSAFAKWHFFNQLHQHFIVTLHCFKKSLVRNTCAFSSEHLCICSRPLEIHPLFKKKTKPAVTNPPKKTLLLSKNQPHIKGIMETGKPAPGSSRRGLVNRRQSRLSRVRAQI